MKQKIILSIALLSLLSLLVFASATMDLLSNPDTLNTPDYKVDVKIEKGWNLLASPGELDWGLENSEIKKSDIITSYAFMPNLQEYARILPEDKMELDKLQSLDDNQTISTAMWVYSKKSGNLSYKTEILWLNQRQLFRGWNFVSITPDMVEKSLNEIKGNCDINGFYFYNSGGWTQDMSNLLLDNNNILDDDWEGLGAVIKVSNNCKFGSSSTSATSPPTLPNSQNQNTDFDFQENIGDYDFRVLDFNDEELCDNSYSPSLCVRALYSAFYTLTGESASDIFESNDIIFFKVTSGIENSKENIKSLGKTSINNVYSSENTVNWFYDSDKYITIKQWGEDVKSEESPVVEYLINKYPPITI